MIDRLDGNLLARSGWTFSGVEVTVEHRERAAGDFDAERVSGKNCRRGVADIDGEAIAASRLEQVGILVRIARAGTQYPSASPRAVPSAATSISFTTQSASGASTLTHRSAEIRPAIESGLFWIAAVYTRTSSRSSMLRRSKGRHGVEREGRGASAASDGVGRAGRTGSGRPARIPWALRGSTFRLLRACWLCPTSGGRKEC